MQKACLTAELSEKYVQIKIEIQKRLEDFKLVPKAQYFYEFCFCICTPQSKAVNALRVQNELMQVNFLNKPFDPTPILRKPDSYIRFHNQKAELLMKAREFFPEIQQILDLDMSNIAKRDWLADNFNGFGMKESSHFLRNIGYQNLAILDRHILRHLVNCGVYSEIPNISTKKKYKETEQRFLDFADDISIPIDELDLLFWAFSAGQIIK